MEIGDLSKWWVDMWKKRASIMEILKWMPWLCRIFWEEVPLMMAVFSLTWICLRRATSVEKMA